jgi:hypothetical protein
MPNLEGCVSSDKEFITPKNAPQSSSTAATVVLLADDCLQLTVETVALFCVAVVANVELTSDHKPSRPDEAARVRCGGSFSTSASWARLAITRALE